LHNIKWTAVSVNTQLANCCWLCFLPRQTTLWDTLQIKWSSVVHVSWKEREVTSEYLT